MLQMDLRLELKREGIETLCSVASGLQFNLTSITDITMADYYDYYYYYYNYSTSLGSLLAFSPRILTQWDFFFFDWSIRLRLVHLKTTPSR